jgi:hypothetical protein
MGGDGESLAGFVSTNTGRTEVRLDVDGERARLTVWARWMGTPLLDVVLLCQHEATGSHSGALVVVGACRPDEEPGDIPLPPSDGDILLEYVRVPVQPAVYGGGGMWAVAGEWNEEFTMVLWLHPEAAFDDGTDLEPEEYDVAPELFRPVASALAWLKRPWKLG